MWRKFPFWLKCGIIAGLIPVIGLLELVSDNAFVTAISKFIYDVTVPAQAISGVILLLITVLLGVFDRSILGVIFGSGAEPWTTIFGVVHVILTIAFMFLFGAIVGKLIDKFRSKKSH